MVQNTYRIVFYGEELYAVQEKVPYLFFFSKWKTISRPFITFDRARTFMREHFRTLKEEDKSNHECVIATYHMIG